MTGQLSSHSAGQGVKPTAYNSCSRHSFYPICTDSQQAPKQVTKTDSSAHLCEKSVLQSKYFFCDFPMSSSSFFDTILSLLLDTREKRSARDGAGRPHDEQREGARSSSAGFFPTVRHSSQHAHGTPTHHVWGGSIALYITPSSSFLFLALSRSILLSLP